MKKITKKTEAEMFFNELIVLCKRYGINTNSTETFFIDIMSARRLLKSEVNQIKKK